ITPRRWGNKEDWETDKKQQGKWADVRAYDADDIEQWLEMAPAVNIWLGKLIGKRQDQSQDIETFWNEWKSATNPQFSEELLLFGREMETERIQSWLDSSGGISVQSDSIEESLSFLVAYIHSLPFALKSNILSRCVIANDLNVFRTLVANNDQLILIPMFVGPVPIGSAIEKGHKVYVPLDRSVSSNRDTLKLPAFSRRTLEKALISAKLNAEQAQELAASSKGSLSILRRLTAVIPEIYSPVWARPDEARNLIPILLAGEWNHSNTHDRIILSKLAGKPYEELLSIFTRWANEPDAPVNKIGDNHQLISRIDSWQHLNKYIDVDDINKLSEVIEDVLGRIDPIYDMPKDERFMAAIHGKILPYSNNLRRGLCESLALISNHTNVQLTDGVQRIVWMLLREGASWDYWASLDEALPYLAEASPNAFLSGLEKSLNNSEFKMLNILKQDTTMGGCAQSDLLWALETCAWNPSYLGQVSILLAKLDRVDSGGNYSNRPLNSLRDIFLCWHPQTTASISKRFEVIDALLSCEPIVGWKLLCKLLPSTGSSTTGTRKPKWKDWSKVFEEGITDLEYFECIQNVSQRIITHVGTEFTRWIDIIDRLDRMPQQYCYELLAKLSSVDLNEIDPDTRLKIWGALRNEVYRHRKFADAEWSLPKDVTETLYEQYCRFEPHDLIEKYSWLFGWQPEHPDCIEEDWDENEKQVERIQIIAVDEVLRHSNLMILLDMAEQVERPSTLGFISGKNNTVKANIIKILTDALSKDRPKKSEFASGLVWSFYQDEKWVEINKILTMTEGIWSAEQLAEFYRYLPFNKETWGYFSNSSEIRELYWRGLPINLRPLEEDYLEAIQCLLEYDRPSVAFHIFAFMLRTNISPPSEMVIEVLDRIIKQEPDSKDWLSIKSNFDYQLNRIIAYLDRVGTSKETLERLEWSYLPLFRYGRKPKYLLRKLSQEPDFFVQVIAAIYKRETDVEEVVTTIDENIQYRAKLAYELLNEWTIVPGISDDGTFDKVFFERWITEARELCNSDGRGRVADSELGEMLAYSPHGVDKHWPHEGVREIIEVVQSEALERGISIGVYNKRGTYSKSIGEGGIQERRLAEQYKEFADALEGRWIRTAAVLRGVSEDYLRNAQKEDIRAQLDD
ncbi:MAG: hypothetical protein WD907_02845, partial [Bacilli bacterium]